MGLSRVLTWLQVLVIVLFIVPEILQKTENSCPCWHHGQLLSLLLSLLNWENVNVSKNHTRKRLLGQSFSREVFSPKNKINFIFGSSNFFQSYRGVLPKNIILPNRVQNTVQLNDNGAFCKGASPFPPFFPVAVPQQKAIETLETHLHVGPFVLGLLQTVLFVARFCCGCAVVSLLTRNETPAGCWFHWCCCCCCWLPCCFACVASPGAHFRTDFRGPNFRKKCSSKYFRKSLHKISQNTRILKIHPKTHFRRKMALRQIIRSK